MKIKERKEAYRFKLEQQLQQDGVKQVQDGRQKITGMKQKGGSLPDGDHNLADDLKGFFDRFDSPTPPHTSASSSTSSCAYDSPSIPSQVGAGPTEVRESSGA